MSKQVPWNKIILEEFIEQACLSKTEEMIMRTRVKGWSIKEQSHKLQWYLRSYTKYRCTTKCCGKFNYQHA